ncbi:hypothetical protein [Streptomyces sp. NPDC085932]|uniref:hypothetical protein n=1 Tax=Streptomyces sp. NPDC085932 TaxID=3365741 RepID=UPI0037D63828
MRRISPVLVPVFSAVFIVGCSGESEDKGGSPEGVRSSSSDSGASDREKVLEERAEKALALGAGDETGASFVEAGMERVGDGIHTRSVLSTGASYSLAVVCSGTGEVRLTVSVKRTEPQTVACDGVPVRQRLADVPAQVGIDVDGLAGASGIVGWRIDEVVE